VVRSISAPTTIAAEATFIITFNAAPSSPFLPPSNQSINQSICCLALLSAQATFAKT
jgi:hypothetical protein